MSPIFDTIDALDIKQLYSLHNQTWGFDNIKKKLMLGILIFVDFDPIGYSLPCCGSL
jgi:hypothetical protein